MRGGSFGWGWAGAGWPRALLALVVLFVAALSWPAGVLAQDKIEFIAEVQPTTVPVGGQLTLTLSVIGGARAISEPKLPILSGFQVYSSGRSQSISIVNGKVSSATTFTYLLIANVEGTHTIEPAEITIGGQVYRTQPLTVQVTAGRAPTAPPLGPSTPSGPAPALQNDELFVDLVVDKPQAYLGEQITLSFRFFQRINLLDQPRYAPPALSGFWVEQMSPQTQSRQTVQGRTYVVTELKTALFPTSVGVQSIGPAALEIRDFFVGSKTLTAAPISVTVKPLPEVGRPADFAGAVGRYQVSAWLEPMSGRAHEPISVFFKVSGEGNIQNVPEPAWNLPAGLRAYDAKSRAESKYPNYVVQGEKIFEKLIVPEREGEWTIPPLALVYFDPGDGQYHRAESQPLTLHVAPGRPEAASATTPGAVGQALAARDIRHIKPAPARVQPLAAPIYRQAGFWALWIAPALALLGGLLLQARRRRLLRDPRYARLQRSHRLARRRLRQARVRVGAGEARAACAAIAEAITQYIADKTDRAAAGLTRADILEILEQRGAGEDAAQQFDSCWERCEQGRFAPTSLDAGALERLLADAEELIVQLEELPWAAR